MKDGIYFEVEGLEKALMKLERLAEIDRKKARQFKAGIKKAAKPMVTAVKASIKAVKIKRRLLKVYKQNAPKILQSVSTKK
jgi:endo-alpha-1,4-polygalactosaminidase (GH114 family)